MELLPSIFRKKTKVLSLSNENIFLLFTPLLIDRSIASNLFDSSKYWVVSPELDINNYKLNNKIVIDYKDYGSISLCNKSIILCWRTLWRLLFKQKRIYIKMYRLWEFYYCQLCIENIVRDNNIIFSNQSDRWALMFDRLKTHNKILCQHGICSDRYELPHKLHNIDRFYAISNNTWQNAYYSILACYIFL